MPKDVLKHLRCKKELISLTLKTKLVNGQSTFNVADSFQKCQILLKWSFKRPNGNPEMQNNALQSGCPSVFIFNESLKFNKSRIEPQS